LALEFSLQNLPTGWILTWGIERLYAGGTLQVLTVFDTVVTIKCKYSGKGFIIPAHYNLYIRLKTWFQIKDEGLVSLCVAELHMREIYWNND